MTRLVPWAIVAAGISGVTVNVLRVRADVSLAGPSIAAQALEIAAAVSLIVVGGSAGQGKEGWLLAAAGTGWLLAEWASPAAPGAGAFTVGLVTTQVSLPLVLASRWRRLRVERGQAVLLALSVLLALVAALMGGPLAAVVASPRDTGCTDCAQDLIALAHDVGLNGLLTRLSGQLTISAGISAVAWLAWSVVGIRSGRQSPQLSASVAADAAAAAFAAAVAGASAAVLLGGFADPLAYKWHEAADGALVVLSVAVAAPAIRAARARRDVARAAVAVADQADVSAADALAAALDDADLRVAYPTSDGSWCDHRGEIVSLPERDVTVIKEAGETLAALLHSGPTRIDRAAIAGAVSAARILLDIERIEAGAMTRVNDLRIARHLVVETADAARASLERDLHDGAQQRLVALRYALGLAAAHAGRLADPALAARLADADIAAEYALTDLRELAHGISAAALAVEGLAGAVRTAAEGTSVTILELPTEQLPGRVERAVYRFVADLMRELTRTSASGLRLAIRRLGAEVAVVVEYQVGPNYGNLIPAHVADRVAVAGGQLHQSDHDGRRRLIAVLPCE